MAVLVGVRGHDQLVFHDLPRGLHAFACTDGGVAIHDEDVVRVQIEDEFEGGLVADVQAIHVHRAVAQADAGEQVVVRQRGVADVVGIAAHVRLHGLRLLPSLHHVAKPANWVMYSS